MPLNGSLCGAANGTHSCRVSFETKEDPKVSLIEEENHIKQQKAVDRELWLEKHPNILQHLKTFFSWARKKRIAVFLDYDGTLTPIVPDHDRAFMAQPMRDAVRNIARLFPTAIISGRGREKVQDFVKLKELYYAGSHGMDILGPQERQGSNGAGGPSTADLAYQPALDFVPLIEATHAQLLELMKPIPKSSVEHNKFCLSVHFRNVEPVYHERLKKAVVDLTAQHPQLQLKTGRKVLEVRPKIAWHKGNALTHLLKALDLDDHDDVLPIYIGDDKTDEDAFEVLLRRDPRGVGILVSSIVKPTHADFTLENPKEVMDFLERLMAWGQTADNGWHDAPACNGWHLQDGPAKDTHADDTDGLASGGEGPAFEQLRLDADDNANGANARRASGLGRPPRPLLSSFAPSGTSAFGTISTSAFGIGAASAGDLARQGSGSIPPCVTGNMSWEGISSLMGSESIRSELPEDLDEFETPPSNSMLLGADVTPPGGSQAQSPVSPGKAPASE